VRFRVGMPAGSQGDPRRACHHPEDGLEAAEGEQEATVHDEILVLSGTPVELGAAARGQRGHLHTASRGPRGSKLAGHAPGRCGTRARMAVQWR
jgi:hypothetical protein